MDLDILTDEIKNNIKDREIMFELSKLIDQKTKLLIYKKLQKQNYVYLNELPLLLNITDILLDNFNFHSLDFNIANFDIIFLNKNYKIIQFLENTLNNLDYIQYYHLFIQSAVRNFYKLNYKKSIDIPNLENFFVNKEKLNISDVEIINNLMSYKYVLNPIFLYQLAKNVNLVVFARFFKLFNGKEIELDKILINSLQNKYDKDVFNFIYAYLKTNNLLNKILDSSIREMNDNNIIISDICFYSLVEKIDTKKINYYINKNINSFETLISDLSDQKILEILSQISIEKAKYISMKYFKNKSFKVDDITTHFLKTEEGEKISNFLKINYNDCKNQV